MKNFKGGEFRGGGRKEFGGRPKFGGGFPNKGADRGGRFGGPKEMFQATCSVCQKSCEVPFRPSGDKPVYCSACFNQRGGDDRRDSRDSERPRHDSRPGAMPAARVEKSAESFELIAIKRQLTVIEARLNRILDIINPPLPAVKNTPVVESPVLADAKPTPVAKKAKAKKAIKKVVLAKKTVKKTVKKAAKKK